MSLFRKVGRAFEESKRSLLAGADDPYVCTACEKGLTEAYDSCPYCGAEAVEATDTAE